MLHFYSDEKFVPNMPIIYDAEAAFFILGSVTNFEFNSEAANKLLRLIEGVDSRVGHIVNTKFGTVDIKLISTGCKAALSAITDPTRVMSTIEMGDNAIKALTSIADIAEAHILLYYGIPDIDTEKKNVIVEYDGQLCTLAEAFNMSVNHMCETEWKQ